MKTTERKWELELEDIDTLERIRCDVEGTAALLAGLAESRGEIGRGDIEAVNILILKLFDSSEKLEKIVKKLEGENK